MKKKPVEELLTVNIGEALKEAAANGHLEVVNAILNKINFNSLSPKNKYMMPEKPESSGQIENIVFAGGGVKVLSYAGAIEALEKLNILNNVKSIAGTSGGAITALCIGLGYNASEIKKILNDLDFTKFTDKVVGGTFISDIDGLMDGTGSRWTNIYAIGEITTASTNIYEQGYVVPGNAFKSFLENLITDKGYKETLTFNELHNSGKTNTKDIYVLGTNLNKQTYEVFSHKTTPDMPIATAVHLSGSFPLFFKPVEYNGSLYVDGGIIDNYPITLFDKEVEMNHINTDSPKNELTIGFVPTNGKLIKSFETGQEPPVVNPTDTVLHQVQAIVSTVLDAAQHYVLRQEYERSVFIDDFGTSALKFDLADEVKQNLMKSGYCYTLQFIKNRIDQSSNDYCSVSENNCNVNIKDVISYIGECQDILAVT